MPSPTPLYQIEECPDLYVDACVCDEQRNLVFLSAWGRDTVTQEFLARLTLGREENGIDHFHIIVDGRRSKPIARGCGGPFGEAMKRCGFVPVRGRYRQQTGSLAMGQQETISPSAVYFSSRIQSCCQQRQG